MVHDYHLSIKGKTEGYEKTQIVGSIERYKFVFYIDIGLARHQVTVAPFTAGDVPSGVLGAEICDQPLKAFMVRTSVCVTRAGAGASGAPACATPHVPDVRHAPSGGWGTNPRPAPPHSAPPTPPRPHYPPAGGSSVTTPSRGRHC